MGIYLPNQFLYFVVYNVGKLMHTTLVFRVLRYYFRENGAEIFNTFIPDVEYVELKQP